MQKYYILKSITRNAFLKDMSFGDALMVGSEDKAEQFRSRSNAECMLAILDNMEIIEVIEFDDGEKWYA